MDNKILITGVNGFIGNNLALKFIEEGGNVLGIGMEPYSFDRRVQYYQLDMSIVSTERILKEFRPNLIIHCAGAADVGYSVRHPQKDMDLNLCVPVKLLREILQAELDCKIILLSSAAVYGNPDELPIKEHAKYDPISPYALHKTLMEQAAEYYIRRHKMDIRILRIFSAYGGGLRKQLFWDLAQKYVNDDIVELGGTGKETRDFIHIFDLVNAIKIVCQSNQSDCYIYNIANGKEITIEEAASCFKKIISDMTSLTMKKIVFDGIERAGNPLYWRADITKLNKLGYQQKMDMHSGIREYVSWLIESGVIYNERKK